VTTAEVDVPYESDINRALKACVHLAAFHTKLHGNAPVISGSGFVFERRGRYILVTAEHVLRGHEDAEGIDGYLEKHADAYAELLVSGEGGPCNCVPFHLRGGSIRISASELAKVAQASVEARTYTVLQAADLEVIVLDDLYRHNLRAAGLVPFQWDQVRLLGPADASQNMCGGHLAAFMLGVPRISSLLNEQSGDYHFLFSALPLALLHVDPPFADFLGAWDGGEPSSDVRGMSGGAIVAFGADRPYVLGVQLSQRRECGRRVYKALMVNKLLEIIDRLLEEAGV
jgi:hypothetical protein